MDLREPDEDRRPRRGTGRAGAPPGDASFARGARPVTVADLLGRPSKLLSASAQSTTPGPIRASACPSPGSSPPSLTSSRRATEARRSAPSSRRLRTSDSSRSPSTTHLIPRDRRRADPRGTGMAGNGLRPDRHAERRRAALDRPRDQAASPDCDPSARPRAHPRPRRAGLGGRKPLAHASAAVAPLRRRTQRRARGLPRHPPLDRRHVRLDLVPVARRTPAWSRPPAARVTRPGRA